MELSILDTHGLPDGSILSVRSGPTRRQSPLPCPAPFKLPAGPWPLRIDVLAMLGKSFQGSSLADLDAEGRCKVPLEARDGRKMSVTLQVYDGKGRPKTTPALTSRTAADDLDGDLSPKGRPRRDTEAEARAYLERHRLHEFMHALFELLLRERPEDPYAYITLRFREAAELEMKQPPPPPTSKLDFVSQVEKIPRSMSGSPPGEVPRSLVSTAPGSTATTAQEAQSGSSASIASPAPSSPEGVMQVMVRSMRGRTLARMVCKPEDKVLSLKERLEAGLGIPATSMQLLWWAETLPNSCSLQDFHVPPGAVSLHLASATRDPRLKTAVTGSSDGGLRLWNLQDGELIRDFDCGGSSAVLAVAVDWESMRAVTGAFSGEVLLWDLKEAKQLLTMRGHTAEVNTVELDMPGMRALTASGDSTARLWDLNSGACLQTLQAGVTVYTLAVDWPRMKACGGLRSGLVRMWDLTTGAIEQDFEGGQAVGEATRTTVTAVAIDCAGRRAVSGMDDGHLAYWHFAPAESSSAGSEGEPAPAPAPPPPTKTLLAHYSAVRSIQAHWTAKESRALVGSDDGSLSLWRLDTQECLARLIRHVGYIWTVHADWARSRAISGAFDGCLKLWDLRTGDCLRTIQAHSRPVRSVCGG